MSFSKFLDPKNDFAFKRIFGTEKNQDILIHFLNDMLGFKGHAQIKTVSFLKTAQDPEIASKKQSLIDVLCVDEMGRQYIVEMQVARTPGFEKRAQYYAAKAYSRQLNKGEEYHQLKEIIFLAITDFVMFPDKTAYKSDHVILDKETYSQDLKDFYFTFLELPKFKKEIDELEGIVEKWAYFFKHAEETSEHDILKIVGSDRVIQRAYEELNRFSWSEIELNTYEQEEKRERDAKAIEAQKLLDLEEAKAKAKAEIEAIKAEVETAKAEVETAKAEVETAKAEVETAKAEVEATKAEVEATKAEVEAAKSKYIEKGRTAGMEHVAKHMKQTGLAIEEIAKYTGLPKAEIDAL